MDTEMLFGGSKEDKKLNVEFQTKLNKLINKLGTIKKKQGTIKKKKSF